MSYETRRQYPVIIGPHPLMRPWDAETTATIGDLVPAPPTSTSGSELILRASGTPDAADVSIGVTVSGGGYPDAGAAIRVTPDGSATQFGWDPPIEVGYIEPVAWSTGETASLTTLSAATLPDGRVIVIREAVFNFGGTPYSTCLVYVREVDGTWTAAGSSLIGQAVALPITPQITVAGDGILRIFALRHITSAEVGTVDVWEIADTASTSDILDTTAWSYVTGVLDAPLDKGTLYPTQLRAVSAGGQHLLTMLVDNTLHQYYSADGLNFRKVAGTIANVRHGYALGYIAGAYVMAYAISTDDTLRTRSIGGAASPLASAEAVTVEAVYYDSTTVDTLTLIAAYDGTGYLYCNSLEALTTTSDGAVWYTIDGGLSWSPAGLWKGGDNGIQAGTWWRDRVLMMVGADSPLGSYEDSWICCHMGGWTDAPMRQRIKAAREVGARASMTDCWIPSCDPGDVWTVTTTGTPTAGFAAGAAYSVSGGGADTWRARLTGGAVPRAACVAIEVTSGEAQISVAAGDGVTGYSARVTVTPTTITLRDVGAGADVTTITPASPGPWEILLEVEFSACTLRWRQWSAESHTDWSTPVTDTLTAGAFSGSVALDLPAVAGGFNLYKLLGYGSSFPLGLSFYDEGMTRTPSGTGAPLSVRPLWADSGLSVAGAAGPARSGQSWTLTATSRYPVELATWGREYPDPAEMWRSSGLSSEYIAWRFDDDGREIHMPPLWGVVTRGDHAAIGVSWHDGTSWGTETVIDKSATQAYDREGNTLTPNAGASGPYVDADELAGGYAIDSGNRVRRITGNSPGVLFASLTARKAVIYLEGDPFGLSSTGTWRIVWPSVAAVLAPPAEAYGVRIRVGGVAPYTPDGVHTAKILMGPAILLGRPHGSDSTTEYRRNARTWRADTGRSRSAPASRPYRVVTLTWQASMERLWSVHGDDLSDAEPDAITVGGVPVYSRGEVGQTIRAAVDAWAADGVPVAYLPRGYVPGVALPQSIYLHRGGGHVVGTLDPIWTIEHAGIGDEMRDEVVRLGALTLTEIP